MDHILALTPQTSRTHTCATSFGCFCVCVGGCNNKNMAERLVEFDGLNDVRRQVQRQENHRNTTEYMLLTSFIRWRQLLRPHSGQRFLWSSMIPDCLIPAAATRSSVTHCYYLATFSFSLSAHCSPFQDQLERTVWNQTQNEMVLQRESGALIVQCLPGLPSHWSAISNTQPVLM